jgi:hypothetical protein
VAVAVQAEFLGVGLLHHLLALSEPHLVGTLVMVTSLLVVVLQEIRAQQLVRLLLVETTLAQQTIGEPLVVVVARQA